MSTTPTAPIHTGYSTAEVSKLSGLSERSVRSFIKSGLIQPRLGRRRNFRFSFQDLVLLRTAAELYAHLPPRKVHRALRRLQKVLPEGRHLTALQITAEGEDLVVHDGDERWVPTGQRLFNFEISELAKQAVPVALESTQHLSHGKTGPTAQAWYEVGCEMEPLDLEEAIAAYEKALDADPRHADAHINLGRLRHELRQLDRAVGHYRMALEVRPADATAAFNLGVVLEDLGRRDEAIKAYLSALQADETSADVHYNLSRLYEAEGRVAEAIQHLKRCRALQKETP